MPGSLGIRPEHGHRSVEDVEGILLIGHLRRGVQQEVVGVSPVPGADHAIVEHQLPEGYAMRVADAPALVVLPGVRVVRSVEGLGAVLRADEMTGGPREPVAAQHAFDVRQMGHSPPDSMLASGHKAQPDNSVEQLLAATPFVRTGQRVFRVVALVKRLGGGDIYEPPEER